MKNIQLHDRCVGFSLVEVLIALAVFSIGLLGLANLQGQSISSSYNAHLRTQATSLARSIIDRMRANRDQAVSSNNYFTNFSQNPPAAVTNCSSVDCSPEDIAQLDLLEWKCNLGVYMQQAFCTNLVSQATLPNGDGQIEAQGGTGQTKVTVRWTDTSGEDHEVIMFSSL